MKKLFVYAHTHWDREWYKPFEIFRLHLVRVLQQIVSDLESGDLPPFYLDGQSIIFEDAMEIDPALGPRLAALMASGKVSAGPWFVLPDEMLVCGESLIRNLQMGIAAVSRFGKAEMVGYSPDTFGHSQDLPRILCGFGIKSAFVWRGVPPLSYGPSFWWRSPDGSRVLAYHFSRGYYQPSLLEKSRGAESEEALNQISQELRSFAEDRRQWDNSSLYEKTPNALIYPVGADHSAPPRKLKQSLDELNRSLNKHGLELIPTHLSGFAELLAEQANADNILVGMLSGELMDNCAAAENGNAFLLQGVLSSRLYLKGENRRAEQRLFRFAEPLFSILAARGLVKYPGAELCRALRLLLENHPHDSICGCSVDEVHEEMRLRFARLHQIIDALVDDARLKLALLPESDERSPEDPSCSLKRLRVINPSGRAFTGVIPFQWLLLPGAETEPSGTVQIIEKAECEQLFSGWGRVPYYAPVESRRGYIWVENLPPFGELNLSWPPEDTAAGAQAGASFPVASVRGKTIDNGILRASVDDRGRIKVVWRVPGGKEQQYELSHELVDTGDGGDTYNYDPLSQDSCVQGRLISISAGKKGPLLASLIFKYEVLIPEGLVETASARSSGGAAAIPLFRRSGKKLRHEIETEMILKRGRRMLEFESNWQNLASGHRLELRFNTGYPVHTSFAENHFSLVRRYHQTKNRHRSELPVEPGFEAHCDRHPAQRFVICNGQLFLNKGLPEYGAEGDSFCLTLLRSVSKLSRGRIRSRGGGAGPHLNVPGAECKGPNKASYAWAPLALFSRAKILADRLDDAVVADAFDLAGAYEQEVFSAFSADADTGTGSMFRSENPGVIILNSHMSGKDNALLLRLLNLSAETSGTRLLVDFQFQSAHLCRLDEEIGDEVFLQQHHLQDDTGAQQCFLDINFGANELKTVKFRLGDGNSSNPARAAKARKRRTAAKKSG